jgi:hypothetical protein
MEPEDFDMKARQANEEAFPDFENEAWDKMELLLDKHLPQKKDKKRFFFWWFAALIPVALIGSYFLFNNSNNKIQPVAKQTNSISKTNNNQPSTQNTDVPQNQNDSSHKSDISKTNSPAIIDKTNNTGSNHLKEDENDKATSLKISNRTTSKKVVGQNLAGTNFHPALKNKVENNQSTFTPHPGNASSSKEKEVAVNEYNKTKASTAKTINASKEKDIVTSTQTKNTITGKENNKPLSQATDTSTIKKENSYVKSNDKSIAKKKAFTNNFYLTLTSGVEANGTSLSNLGAATPVYGAGVQYARGKIFIRTGVMVTKKLYAAKDKDYTRKAGTWMSIVTFDNIDANCKVIEIPVSVGYTIISKKKTSAYITAGTSAYFMKKEDYQFYFKNQSGNDTTRNANFTNNSSHYLSSINLSAGIEKKISNRLSITAEPTIKIPVSGIGFGKIKLYGAGVLVTAKIRLK